MKKMSLQLSKVLGALMVAGLTMVSLGASGQSKGKTMTVKGEVLDMACYMGHGAHGAGHAQCAKMCLQGGSPAGLLSSDGKVYLLVADHDKPEPYTEVRKHGAGQVTVTGQFNDRNGVQALVVEDVKVAGS